MNEWLDQSLELLINRGRTGEPRVAALAKVGLAKFFDIRSFVELIDVSHSSQFFTGTGEIWKTFDLKTPRMLSGAYHPSVILLGCTRCEKDGEDIESREVRLAANTTSGKTIKGGQHTRGRERERESKL